MSSTLGTPDTLPVQPASEPSSPTSLGPPLLEPTIKRPAGDYQYHGATHCGECRHPKKYDHIAWRRGLVDGYSCQCSKSPSPLDNTPEETLDAAPTPQLARRTPRCYRCKSTSHLVQICPKQRCTRKCTKCGELGHNASKCSLRAWREAPIIPNALGLLAEAAEQMMLLERINLSSKESALGMKNASNAPSGGLTYSYVATTALDSTRKKEKWTRWTATTRRIGTKAATET